MAKIVLRRNTRVKMNTRTQYGALGEGAPRANIAHEGGWMRDKNIDEDVHDHSLDDDRPSPLDKIFR